MSNPVDVLRKELDIVRADIKDMVGQIGRKIGEQDRMLSQTELWMSKVMEALQAIDARISLLEKSKPATDLDKEV